MVLLLGTGPITKALGNLLQLIGIKTCEDSNCRTLVMIDYDQYDISTIGEIFIGDKLLIYLKSEYAWETNRQHLLCFLTEYHDTYELKLEKFSIGDLVNVLGDIYGWDGCSYQRNTSKFRPDDLSSQSRKKKITHNYPHLIDHAKRLIGVYLHNTKNEEWTFRCKADAEIFLNKEDDQSYKDFISSFNDEKLWRDGYTELYKLSHTLSLLGINKSYLSVLYALEKEYKSLERVVFPPLYQEEINSRKSIRKEVQKCVNAFERIEEKAKNEYNKQ